MITKADFKVIEPPDAEWLTRLRQRHYVYAPKEDKIFAVEWAWEAPDPGSFTGRIGLRQMWFEHGEWGGCAEITIWSTTPHGAGMDGSQILKPLEGNCPDEAPAMSPIWQRRVEKRLAMMQHQLDQLQAFVVHTLTMMGVIDETP